MILPTTLPVLTRDLDICCSDKYKCYCLSEAICFSSKTPNVLLAFAMMYTEEKDLTSSCGIIVNRFLLQYQLLFVETAAVGKEKTTFATIDSEDLMRKVSKLCFSFIARYIFERT